MKIRVGFSPCGTPHPPALKPLYAPAESPQRIFALDKKSQPLAQERLGAAEGTIQETATLLIGRTTQKFRPNSLLLRRLEHRFTACGKTTFRRGFVSGHDFTGC